jgi:hypothetical protein
MAFRTSGRPDPRGHLLRLPGFPDEAVEISERLVEPLPQVLELLHALPPVFKQLVDPRQDDRPADLLLPSTLDLFGVAIGEHRRS